MLFMKEYKSNKGLRVRALTFTGENFDDIYDMLFIFSQTGALEIEKLDRYFKMSIEYENTTIEQVVHAGDVVVINDSIPFAMAIDAYMFYEYFNVVE